MPVEAARTRAGILCGAGRSGRFFSTSEDARGRIDVQANLPAEQSSPGQAPWLPPPNADPRRTRHPRPAPGEGSSPAVGVTRADERKRRRARPVDRPGISRRPGGSVCRARLGGGRVRGRPSRGRRGRPQPGPANPPGFVAGGRARGPRWGRRRAGRSRNDSRGTSARAGAGGEAVALARAGDRDVTRVRRFLWVAGAPSRGVLLGLIGLYRVTLSSWLGGQCRFYPTCSAYAESAIRTHGAVRGTLLATWRLARCGPFTAGGVDHVPPRRRERLAYDKTIQSGASTSGAST